MEANYLKRASFDELVETDPSESEEDSILTSGRTRAWEQLEDEDDYLSVDEDLPAEQQWNELQRRLDRRSACLNGALNKKSCSFRLQIQRRERLARRLRERDLLLDLLNPVDTDAITQTKLQNLLDELVPLPEQKGGLVSKIYETIQYESNTFVKAAFLVLLHVIAMESFYGFIRSIFDVFYRYMSDLLGTESDVFGICLHSGLFVAGIVLLRSTGYLYWWLKDSDYDLFKFDCHNRLELNYPESRFISSVRSRDLLCLFVYLIGYNLVTTVAMYIQDEQDWLFSKQDILEALPSRILEYDYNGFPCDLTCTEGMELEEQWDWWMLSGDYDYTRRTFSLTSHKTYWMNYVHQFDTTEADEYTAHTDQTEMLMSACIFVVCVLAMRWYGFLFWRTF